MSKKFLYSFFIGVVFGCVVLVPMSPMFVSDGERGLLWACLIGAFAAFLLGLEAGLAANDYKILFNDKKSDLAGFHFGFVVPVVFALLFFRYAIFDIVVIVPIMYLCEKLVFEFSFTWRRS